MFTHDKRYGWAVLVIGERLELYCIRVLDLLQYGWARIELSLRMYTVFAVVLNRTGTPPRYCDINNTYQYSYRDTLAILRRRLHIHASEGATWAFLVFLAVVTAFLS